VLEYLKLLVSQTPKVLLGLVLFCSVALVAPDRLLRGMGFLPFTGSVRQWLEVVLLLSGCLLLSHLAFSLSSFLKGRLNGWVIVHRGKKRLRDLTRTEKEILKDYLEQDSMTQAFDCRNGSVIALENEHILYRASEISLEDLNFPFNLQPWARQYLRQHPELLSLTSPAGMG
jgi:hypothetical protein